MKRCYHLWEDRSRAYTPPSGEFSIEHGTIDLVEKLKFGITTIEQRCIKCHQLKHYVVAGKVGT